MFYNLREGSQIIDSGSNRRTRGVCFLISVLFHALLVFLLISFNFAIRFDALEEKVVEVFISPPVKMVVPEIGDDPVFRDNSLRRSQNAAQKQGTEYSDYGSRSGVGPGIAGSEREDKNVEIETGGIASDFDLSFESEPELPLASEFGLSRSIEKESDLYEVMKWSYKKKLNLSGYRYSDYSGSFPSKSRHSGGRYGSGRSALRARASASQKKYDITPWAEGVMNIIQKNWAIPLEQGAIPKGKVGISVVIERNGGISSLEIIDSSHVLLLDQAAFEALKLSVPFPELPEDFPEKDLEVYFLFQYND